MAECTITPHDYRLRDRAGPRNRHDIWSCKWCQKWIEVDPGVNPNKTPMTTGNHKEIPR